MKNMLSAAALAAVLTLSGAGVALAQTTTGTGTDATGTIPGTPNTGAGGDAAVNLALLGGSALVAVGAAAALRKAKI